MKKNTLLFILSLIIVWLEKVKSDLITSKDDYHSIQYIFSPFPLMEYNIFNPSASSNRMIYNEQEQILITSWGSAGLAIFDITTNSLEYFFASSKFIRGMAVTADGQFIFFMQDNRLTSYLYERTQKQKKLLPRSKSDETTNETFDIIITKDDEVVITMQSSGRINAYDVRQKAIIDGYFPLLNSVEAKSSIVSRGYLTQGENFLFIANDYSGVVLFDFKKQVISTSSTSSDIKVDMSFKSQIPADWQIIDLTLTYDQTYLYAADCWSGILVIDTHSNDTPNNNQWVPELKIKNFWPDLSSTIPFSLKVTLDDKFLLVSSRQQGVLVLDITIKSSPILFQKIPIKGHAFAIQLANKDSQLFYANGETIFLFERVSPNLNLDFPNLHNNHISKLYPIGSYQYRWRCYVSNNDSYFFGAFDKGGLFIYSLKNLPQSVQDPNPFIMKPVNHLTFSELTSIDRVLFFEKSDLMFLAVSQESSKMFMYKISEVIKQDNFSVQPIFKLPFDSAQSISETLVTNYDQSIIAVTTDNSVLLIDSKNSNEINLITQYSVPSRMIGTCNSVLFSRDSKYMIITIRNFGFISVNIINPRNPILEDELSTLGAEYILDQITDDNYAYLSDGYKGFIILDLNKLPKLFIKSRYSVDGWLNHISPFILDKYLLLSHMDNGYVSLLNVADKAHPITLAKSSYKDQNAMSTCLTQNKKYLFITNNIGVNVFPLWSEVMIHTQILRIIGKENGNISYIPQDPQMKLQIGQTFLFQFIPIYPSQNLKFSDIKYYSSENVLKDPPYWINPKLSSSSVEITAVKDGLGIDVSEPNLNQIVIVFKTAITANSFVFSDIGDQIVTDLTVGKSIWEYLKDADLISTDNYASIKFEQQQTVNFSGLNLGGLEKNDHFQDRVRLTLLKSIQRNPIMFFISPSLKFNEEKGEIETLSSQVSIYLSFNNKDGQFIQITYNGILASYKDEGSSIKLEGTSSAINSVFKNSKIVYFMKSSNITNIDVVFSLQDNNNYDIQKSYKLNDLSTPYQLPEQQLNNTTLNVTDSNKILRQKQHVQINTNEKSLQTQFNSIYANSEIQVETNASFEFSESTFISPDGIHLTYKVYYDEGDGEYSNTMSHQWLQQSSNSLKFYGIPPLSLYKSRLHVKVIATDGYDQYEDIFVIRISSIPFSYIVNLMFKILSPIAAVIGLYSYRSFFFNAIFKDKNIYSNELCIINSFFCKKIALLGDENEKAILLFNSMKKHMNLSQRRKKYRKRTTKKHRSVIVYGLSINSLKDEDAKPKDINVVEINQNQSDNLNNMLSYDDQMQNAVGSPRQSSTNNQLNNNNLINNFINEFSNYNLHMASMTLEKPSFENNQNNTNVNKLQRTNNLNELRKDQQIFLSRMSSIKKQRSSSNPIVDQFTRSDGSIRFSKIIQYMIQEKLTFKYQNEEYSAKVLIKDLKDEKSRLYKSLRAVVARYFLQFDEKTDLFLEFLREEALNHYNYAEKDWYKHYVDINSSPSIVNEQLETISFPQVEIRKNIIRQSLINLRLINFQDNMEKSIGKEVINLRLLYEVLIAETLGLLDYIPNAFSKSQGESIHLKFFEISSIEAFKPIKNPNCSFFRKMMNMTLANYGASQNMKLPNWIKFDQKSSCVILQGMPTASDIEDIVIRIFDKQDYIIREFPLKIVDEEKELPVEYDYESARMSTRKSYFQDQNGNQMNFPIRGQALSESVSPTLIYNSTNQQSKPSIFSNCNGPSSLLNVRQTKATLSLYKRDSGCEVQREDKSSVKQQFSPIGSQVEEISSDDEERSNEKEQSEKMQRSQSEDKQLQLQQSKIEESQEKERNSPNAIHTQQKRSFYLEERVSRGIKSIGEDAISQSLSVTNISPTKSRKSFPAQESQKSREKEEFDLELSSVPISIPNQFQHQQHTDNYFNSQNNHNGQDKIKLP